MADLDPSPPDRSTDPAPAASPERIECLNRRVQLALSAHECHILQHRVEHLSDRVAELERELEAKDDRLDARRRERDELLTRYERILEEKDATARAR